MTRDEAIKTWKEVGLKDFADGAGNHLKPEFLGPHLDRLARSDVAGFVALGMLKLDEPLDVSELVRRADWWTRVGGAVEVSRQSMSDAVDLIVKMKRALELSR